MKRSIVSILIYISAISSVAATQMQTDSSLGRSRIALDRPQMFYSDDTYGRPFAKDPDVVKFKDEYHMYYSMRMKKGYAVGIARSSDLVEWKKVGQLLPGEGCDKKGLAAPAAIILDNKVHLFYQSYGSGPKDAICHAISEDGINFKRNTSNPIFRPSGKWNCGRAIDADAIVYGDKLLLYWATRDPSFKIQMLGVSSAPLGSDYTADKWTQLCDKSILKPELPWEKHCIEAPAVVEHNGQLFMFYAGAYNNEPQQIGLAVSSNGVEWHRLSDYPILPNGEEGRWNSSESGHPGIFTDADDRMYLFFQGNNDRGRTWYLSKMFVQWQGNRPYLVRPRDKEEFHLRKTN